MTARPPLSPRNEVFTVKEVARAAGVPVRRVKASVASAKLQVFRGFLRQADAVQLVRHLRLR